jgi:hypothetical protein
MDLQELLKNEIIKLVLNHTVLDFHIDTKVQWRLVVVVAKVKELLKVKKWLVIEDTKL